MRCLRGVLACLFSVTAFVALVADASAEAPEFGRCVKQSGGRYANSACTVTAEGPGRWEWEPGPGPNRSFTESARGSRAFVWKLATNEEGVCTSESAAGEYTGPRTVGNVRIVLEGCQYLNPETCETIQLAPLTGEVGVYELGATAATNKIGLKLAPEAGSVFAEFDCGAGGINPYVWRGGSVIVPIKSNKMLTKQTLKFVQHHGPGFAEEQVPAHFVGQLADPLEGTGNFTQGGEKVFAPMGWQSTIKLLNEEKLEINSVL